MMVFLDRLSMGFEAMRAGESIDNKYHWKLRWLLINFLPMAQISLMENAFNDWLLTSPLFSPSIYSRMQHHPQGQDHQKTMTQTTLTV
jgi:hypothetical protein